MAISVDGFSANYLSSANSQASASTVDKLRRTRDSLEGATYEELEDTMKTFESYLLEQTLKEVKNSIKEIRGENKDEDPFMASTTDMYMDQMIGSISKQMVEAYGQRLTKDLTDQTARQYGIEIPGEEEKDAAAAAGTVAAANAAQGSQAEAPEETDETAETAEV